MTSPLLRSIRHRVAEWRAMRAEVRHPGVRECLRLAADAPGLGITRVRYLARGGTALVYRGVRVANADLAIKVPRYHAARDGADAERALRREGAVLALLDSAAVPRLAWRPPDGRFFIRELIAGASVGVLAKRRETTAEERRQLVQALLELARSLFPHVHESSQGSFVLRDLKPRNLIREDATGRLKLIDLGSVRREGRDSAMSDGTARLGTGKWLCWAPEQLCGATSVDRRADYFALGATAFAILTGRAPYANEHTDARSAMRHYERSYRDVAAGFAVLRAPAAPFLAACLHPSPDQRPASMMGADA